MIAVAVLAAGMAWLFQAQGRSLLMGQQARTLAVATMLARGKLYDCETDFMKKGFSIGDYDENGKFDEEGYPSFFWECHGYKPDLPMPDAADIAEGAASQGAAELGVPGGGDPSQQLGMGMIAPVLGQISSVVGDSIRELVVIVRWQDGDVWMDVQVTTHIVDTSTVNAIAQQISAMSGNIPGLPGAGGDASGGGGGDRGSGGFGENIRGNAQPAPNAPVFRNGAGGAPK